MDKLSRMILAILLLMVAFVGMIVLIKTPWMPIIYPAGATYPEASSRVAIEQTGVQVGGWDRYTYGSGVWTSAAFPLKKGETVTVEFEVTPKPTQTYAYALSGVSLSVARGIVGYSSIFYAWYGVGGMSYPRECIVPETGDYQVGLINWESHEVKVSFKLTVRTTTILGGEGGMVFVPYGTTQTFVMLSLLLGVGMLVGAVCAILAGPRQIVEPTPSPTPPPLRQVAAREPPLRMKFCRECGAKIASESKFCEECGARLV